MLIALVTGEGALHHCAGDEPDRHAVVFRSFLYRVSHFDVVLRSATDAGIRNDL